MVLRAGLPVGLACAMVVHAAGESAAIRAPSRDCHAVVLHAPPAELERLRGRFSSRGGPSLHFVAIHESDDAPEYAGELMAIGIAPGEPEAARWLQHLPLFRHTCARVAQEPQSRAPDC